MLIVLSEELVMVLASSEEREEVSVDSLSVTVSRVTSLMVDDGESIVVC